MFRPVRCVLFDMDGLLLDTENLYTKGTQMVLDKFGKEYSWEFKAKLMGKNSIEVARMIIENYELPMEPEEWVTRSTEVYKELFPTVGALPGVAKLVHHLAKNNVPLSVATSSSSSAFDMKTVNHSGLFSLFDHIVRGDNPNVKRVKPEPDIFLYAASQHSDIKAEDCLVVEDAPLGVQAGLAAGMQVLMVPHEKLDPLHTEAATLALPNLHLFKPQDFGLPAYDYKPVTHVIFDMDGLLLNTQTIYSQVSARLLEKHGKQPDWEFKMKVIGRRATDVAEMVVNHYNLPYTGDQYLELHQAETHAMFPHCDLLPGVERLLRHLVDRKVKIAVATSSRRDAFELKTQSKHKDIFNLFSHIVTGCDPEVKDAKPDPQIYDVCRRRFSDVPAAENCLVFEDAPNGVEAGLKAGMQVVMIPHHKTMKKYLLPATQMLSSMLDFQPQDFGLPPFHS